MSDMPEKSVRDEFKQSIIQMLKDMADATLEDMTKALLKNGRVGGLLIPANFHDILEPFPFGWDTEYERRSMLKMMKIVLRVKKAMMYVVVNEGYAREYVGTDAEAEINKPHEFGQLSRDPKRIEVMFIMAVSPIHKELRAIKIIREKENDETTKIIRTEPFDSGMSHLEGDLANLLHPNIKEAWETMFND